MDAQPTTVIIVTKDDPAAPGQALMRAMLSVEEQDLPDRLDTSVVRDMGCFTPHQLRMFGAEKAQTPWIAFMEEDDRWPASRLSDMFALIDPMGSTSNGLGVIDSPTGATTILTNREFYLAHAVDGASS